MTVEEINLLVTIITLNLRHFTLHYCITAHLSKSSFVFTTLNTHDLAIIQSQFPTQCETNLWEVYKCVSESPGCCQSVSGVRVRRRNYLVDIYIPSRSFVASSLSF